MSVPSNEDRANLEGNRLRVDRLLLASSLILVVITVAFAGFLSASQFWEGNAVALKVRLLEPGLPDSTRVAMNNERVKFDRWQHVEERQAKVFASLMSLFLVITAFCVPMNLRQRSLTLLKGTELVVALSSLGLAVAAALFCFGVWRP